MNPLDFYREAKERHPGMILMFRLAIGMRWLAKMPKRALVYLGLP
jgi:hypothetical protein